MIYLIEGNRKFQDGDIEGATLCIEAASILAAARARRNPSEARYIKDLDSAFSSRRLIAEKTSDVLKLVVSLREYLGILQELQADETAREEITTSAQQTRSQLAALAGEMYSSGVKRIEDGEGEEGIALILLSRDLVSAMWEGVEDDPSIGMLFAQGEWLLGLMLTASDSANAQERYSNALSVLDKVAEINPDDPDVTALHKQIAEDMTNVSATDDVD